MTITEPRSPVITYAPTREGNGTARRWTRVIRGRLYSFTAATMPNGELRYIASRFDGTDSRFDCEWTKNVLHWTIKPLYPVLELECCPGTNVPYPTNGNDTECPVCHSVFTLTTAEMD